MNILSMARKALLLYIMILIIIPCLQASLYGIIGGDKVCVVEYGVSNNTHLGMKGEVMEKQYNLLPNQQPLVIPSSIVLNSGGIAGVHEATVSVELEDGFESGAEFLARIVPSYNMGVPTASTNIGSEDIGMNWVVSKSYDDGGNVISESKQFFDNNGRGIQGQTKVKYRKNGSTVLTHVFASQTLHDAMGRDAASTLAAPIDNSSFIYKPDFVRYGSGSTVYDYRHFDRYKPTTTETDKTNNPDAVGSSVSGTLGWYYSDNNTWEPYTPVTSYPYSRKTFYNLGTGNVKKVGGAGEPFKIGSGHEVGSYSTSVISELDEYVRVRNKYFTNSGALPASLKNTSVQLISQDPNGREVVQIQDREGHVLLTAIPGNELSISNSVLLEPAYTYSFVNDLGENGYLQYLSIKGNTIRIYESQNNGVSYTLVYNGLANAYTSPYSLGWRYRIVSSDPFSVSYNGHNSSTGSDWTISQNRPAVREGTNQYYFKLLHTGTVNITGSTLFDLYDMNTEQTVSFTSGGSLPSGYYKIINKSDVTLTLAYSSGYSDVSYHFYNQLGQQIATIAPEGVKKLYGSGIDIYTTRNDVPFISWSEYDVQGRLVKSKSTDGGLGKVVYRKDGKIRFSQNAKQELLGHYSYTNYDALGRPIESGEYHPDGSGIAFNDDLTSGSNPMKGILENVSLGGGLTSGVKKDVITTVYDVPNTSHSISGYTQYPYYMRGAVSVTHKYNSVSGSPPYSGHTSATWYSYDEEGKVTWMIKYIDGMGYKTTDYTYSSLGQLVKRVYQKDVSTETFVHYYEYDPANLQLWKVHTNTTDNPGTKKLQASYTYYLHGPLKRVELADDLQGIDYTYTLQGALKSINNSNASADPGGDGSGGSTFQPDAFGMVLDYYPDDYKNTRSGIADIQGLNTTAQVLTESYAGNIKAMSWFSKKPASMPAGSDQPNAYIYNYDDKYQFTESTWGNDLTFSPGNPTTLTTNNHFKETVKHPSSGPGYDANGNILYLQRTDGSGTPTDKFTYNYELNKNRLASVVHDDNNIPQTYATYEYDDLGQLTEETNTFGGTDKSKYIEYDVTGKVIAVYRDLSQTQKVVEYVYDEMGQRIIKRNYNSSYQLIENTYYLGGVIYTQPVSTGIITVQEYEIDGGSGRLGVYYRPTDIYAYQLTDHLGNVRAVVAKSGSSLEVRMYTDYYPFGMTIPRLGGTDDYRYEYQGQYAEKEKATDWNAFELRMYDSRIARWLSVDPENEFWSPYTAMGNDPANLSDPTGGETGDPDPWGGVVPMREFVVKGKHNAYNAMAMDFRAVGAWVDAQRALGFTDEQMSKFIASQTPSSRARRVFEQQMSSTATGIRQRRLSAQEGVGQVAEFVYIGLATEGLGQLVGIGINMYRVHRAARLMKVAGKGGTEGGLNLFKFGSNEATSSTAWRSGDRFLKMFDKGSPKLNWKQNSGFLRREMGAGNPIFDSYRISNGNLIPTSGFLNAERSLLQSRGWIYSPGKGAWLPPGF